MNLQVNLLRVEERLAEVRKEHDALATVSGTTSPLRILQLTSARMPANVRVKVSEMTVGERAVRLVGTTDSYKSVDEIRGQLEAIPEFASVTIQETSPERSSGGVKFTLSIALRTY